jgi:hypothetical protein
MILLSGGLTLMNLLHRRTEEYQQITIIMMLVMLMTSASLNMDRRLINLDWLLGINLKRTNCKSHWD